MGRTLARLLRRAGLQDVQSQPHVVRTRGGEIAHKNLLGVIDAARPLIIESGVYDDAGLDSLTSALHHHLDQPETTTAWAVWQAWGWRPGE
jgi:hypothetical protein